MTSLSVALPQLVKEAIDQAEAAAVMHGETCRKARMSN